MARAIYRKADVYLLDDPLSAVDAHVGLHLFNKCLGPRGHLGKQNVTRILVTHQVHFLKEADWVVIMRDGKIEAQGTHTDIKNSGVDFSALMSPAEEENGEMGEEDRSGKMSRSASICSERSTAAPDDSSDTKEEIEKIHDLEDSTKGKIKGSLLMHYFRSAEQPVVLFTLFILFIIAQSLASGADYWVAYWYVCIRKVLADSVSCLPFHNRRTQIEEQRTFNERPSASMVKKSANIVDYKSTMVESVNDNVSSLPSTESCAWIHGSILVALFVIALVRYVSSIQCPCWLKGILEIANLTTPLIFHSDRLHTFECA